MSNNGIQLHLQRGRIDSVSYRLTVFFFPYALLEIPSNMVLKVLRPSIWVGAMMLAWGVVMTLMGIVKDYDGLAGARAAVS